MKILLQTIGSKITKNDGGCDRSGQLQDIYQEVVSLPFSSESQVTISKNSFSCLMNIVTCDSELAGEHRLFGRIGL